MSRQPSPSPLELKGAHRAVAGEVRRLAFWGSVLLPLVSLPLLTGVAGERTLPLVGSLAALNVLCLLVGHGHSPRR